MYSPQPHCTRANERIIHTPSAQSRDHLAAQDTGDQSPPDNARPSAGQTSPRVPRGRSHRRRRPPAANQRRAPLTPPKVGPRRRRHVAAAAGNAATRPGRQPAGPVQQRSVATVAISSFTTNFIGIIARVEFLVCRENITGCGVSLVLASAVRVA